MLPTGELHHGVEHSEYRGQYEYFNDERHHDCSLHAWFSFLIPHHDETTPMMASGVLHNNDVTALDESHEASSYQGLVNLSHVSSQTTSNRHEPPLSRSSSANDVASPV